MDNLHNRLKVFFLLCRRRPQRKSYVVIIRYIGHVYVAIVKFKLKSTKRFA